LSATARRQIVTTTHAVILKEEGMVLSTLPTVVPPSVAPRTSANAAGVAVADEPGDTRNPIRNASPALIDNTGRVVAP
jgi:hypothetical protein